MTDIRKGTLLACAASLLAAGFYIPQKAATGHGAVDVVVITMLLVAAVLNTVTALGQREALRLDRITLTAAAVLGGLTVVGNIGMTRALTMNSAGITAVLVQTQILFVAVASWLFLGERITARFAVGAAIALGGFVTMRMASADAGSASTAGMLWALLASVSFGTMHVVTRKVIARIDPVTVNALRLWVAVALLSCLPGRVEGVLEFGRTGWLYVIAAAALGPYLARINIMYAVKYIPASHSILITLITPIFAFVFGFAFFGAVPTVTEAIGAAIILAGIALPVLELNRGGRRPTDRTTR